MTRAARRALVGVGAAAAAAGLIALVLGLTTGPAGLPITGRASSQATGSPVTPAAASATPEAQSPSPSEQASAGPGPSAGNAPDAFWFGTDSSYVAIDSRAPYQEPVIGGGYGGYIGMIGNWAAWQPCGGQVIWSATNSSVARANFTSYHTGIGVGGYWFMAGPGVDPRYDGTPGEAAAWGAAQAAEMLSVLPHEPTPVNYPVIFMDIELPGHAPSFTPAPDNGWTAIYTSACSGQVQHGYVAPSLNRADVDGFSSYLTTHSAYKAGVYSSPAIWTTIFGTNPADASIPNTYEWTYTSETSSLSQRPNGWCFPGAGACAEFFGGQTSSSPYALMWQWSGGGGVRNGYGDFDLIDSSRTPLDRQGPSQMDE